MSWFERKIYTDEEVRQARTEEKLPSSLQIGCDAKLWLFDADGQVEGTVPCVVVGVRIVSHNEVYYDLAFAITGTVTLYSVVRDIRGYVTRREVNEMEPNGGLYDVDELCDELTRRVLRRG